MSTNRSMPSGVMIPELSYPDVRESVDWLRRTFGFTERLRIGNQRAQLPFGEGSLVVTQRSARRSRKPLPMFILKPGVVYCSKIEVSWWDTLGICFTSSQGACHDCNGRIPR
jgi:hypothetical protein